MNEEHQSNGFLKILRDLVSSSLETCYIFHHLFGLGVKEGVQAECLLQPKGGEKPNCQMAADIDKHIFPISFCRCHSVTAPSSSGSTLSLIIYYMIT